MKTDLSIKAAIYLRAAELVEQGHCKNAVARTVDGRSVPYYAQDAVAWCYIGAIHKAATEFSSDVPHFYDGFSGCPILWNNAPDTTAAMVAAKLREQAFA